MKKQSKFNRLLLSGSACLALVMGVTACDVEQTQEGKLPEVEVKGGQLPKYDVETADVDIGTKKVEITVPDVNVTMPDEKAAEKSE